MEDIILIIGKLNNRQAYYWKLEDIEETEVNINDYAIVQNLNGFDLVKVTGKVMTYKNLVGSVCGSKYENVKKVVKVIPKKEIVKTEAKEYCGNCGVELTKKNKYMSGMCMECKCGIDWEDKEK